MSSSVFASSAFSGLPNPRLSVDLVVASFRSASRLKQVNLGLPDMTENNDVKQRSVLRSFRLLAAANLLFFS